ncbi:HS12A-like protein [Mya arenaria]|uniref:HS12A-like protein n=1 Tax=Mya arenaria TaxID=6604 RepID=A0ABY7EQ77_MYAAR|nr:HS12A-like protein [Mya arenaria]
MATTKVDDSLRTLLNDDISIAKKTDHLLVAAIDFGTTFTGYAFSTKNILDDRINCSSFQAEGFKSEKAPTCVLLNSDETFNAFGYDAQTKYADLSTFS